MRVHDAYEDNNVEKEERDEESVLAFYKKVFGLRKEHEECLYIRHI
jgi:oligo-1,6-glucosidase